MKTPSVRKGSFIILTTIILLTTAYSVVQQTYLDTSNPLIAHLPHPLSETHYYANKGNLLNVYFTKKAWAWTSVVFFFSWFTSPQPVRILERWTKWTTITIVWLIFTTWFFGPSIIERVILASGGECVLLLPFGNLMVLPIENCFARTSVSPASHPDLFTAFTALPSVDWHAIPKLRRGHDVSGHIFLLTMSTLFLADQLQYSLSVNHKSRSAWHHVAMISTVLAILTSLFATYTTGLYFHSPLEKFSGYALGLAGFSLSILPELFQRTVYKAHIQ